VHRPHCSCSPIIETRLLKEAWPKPFPKGSSVTIVLTTPCSGVRELRKGTRGRTLPAHGLGNRWRVASKSLQTGAK
jgi:hypothetical protein